MAETLVANGIVLSSMPVGENDRRLLLLTKELGRISCFARGARKPTSALVSATRPFAFGKFEIYPGRDSYALYRAEIAEFFEEIVMDVDRSAYGMYFLELTSRFTRENTDESFMLSLLWYSLKALLNERLPKRLVERIFELRVLKNEGLAPEMLPENPFISRHELSPGALRALRFIETTPVGRLFTFTVTEEILYEIGRLSDELLLGALEWPLKSREFLEMMIGGS